MKKLRLLLLAVAALLCCTTAAEAKALSFGLTAGTSTGNYRLKGFDDCTTNNTGYQVGASVSVKALMLTITPEVNYTRNKFSITKRPFGYDMDVVSKSVDMPILVGYSMLKNMLRFEVGPSFSLYDYGEAKYTKMGMKVEQGVGRLHTPVGYVAGVRVVLLDKVILGARYNGQFGTRSNNFNTLRQYNLRYSSYNFSVGIKL